MVARRRLSSLVLVRRRGEEIDVVDGHLRLKSSRKLGVTAVPVIFCDEWSEAQVKAFRLLVNRSGSWATWDEDLVALELADLDALDFDLSLTGFDPFEIDEFLFPEAVEPSAEKAPARPESAVTRQSDRDHDLADLKLDRHDPVNVRVALTSGSLNRPFIIGICQGQTELSSPLLPTERLVAHAS